MMKRRTGNYFPPDEKAPLVAECLRRVQLEEMDFQKKDWNKYYIKYFEQGRAEWGQKFGFIYSDMIANGFTMPVVRFHVDYCYPLRHDELIRIKTVCHWTDAAKMNISYEICAENGMLSARGYTVQLYIDLSGRLMVLRPEFAERFIQKWDELSLI
jgi:Predicted thioesterase